MKITVPGKQAHEDMWRLTQVAPGKALIKTYEGVRIEANGEITLSMCHGQTDTAAQRATHGSIVEPGAVLVPARALRDLLAQHKRAPAVVLETIGDRLSVTADGATAQLPTMNLEDWPAPKVDDSKGELVAEIPVTEELRAMAARAAVAASTDNDRLILTVVRFGGQDDRLVIAATDSYRLTWTTEPLDVEWPLGEDEVLVPARVLSFHLPRFVDGDAVMMVMKLDTPHAHAATRYEVVFADERSAIRVGCIEGTFPNYKQLLPDPKQMIGSFVAPKAAWLEALATLKPVIKAADVPVQISVEGGAVVVEAVSQEHGTARSVLPGSSSDLDADYTIAANAKYLTDGIGLFDGDVPVAVQNPSANDNPRPMIVGQADKDDSLAYLLMPVRM